MEVLDYFEPVDFSRFTGSGRSSGKFFLGQAVERTTTTLSLSNIGSLDIAIIGVPVDDGEIDRAIAESPDIIRDELYRLSILNQKMSIADVGNLKPASSLRGTFLALRDIIDYFNELDVVSVVIGGSQDLTVGICEAFRNSRFFSLTTVDAVLDVKKGVETFHSTNYLTRIFSRLPNLFQFSLLGYQSPLVAEMNLGKTRGVPDHLRLGQLRDDFLKAEPLMRNSDVLSFDLGAIKYADAPATRQKHPNGLRGEEACQIARYAGMSDRLKIFGMFGLTPGDDPHSLTAKLAAEIIWYFLEGCMICKKNNSSLGNNRIVYKVAVNDLEQPFVFLKDPETNRWWYEVSSVTGETTIIACPEAEYRQAAANEIPARWLKFVQKMDELPK